MLQIEYKFIVMAGETRFEHATDGFGDRYSTIEPLPYTFYYTILKIHCQEKITFLLDFILDIDIENFI